MPERLKAILDKITAWWKKFNTKQRSVLISNISNEGDSKLVFIVNKSDEVNAIMALGDNGIPAQAY